MHVENSEIEQTAQRKHVESTALSDAYALRELSIFVSTTYTNRTSSRAGSFSAEQRSEAKTGKTPNSGGQTPKH